MYYAKYFEKIKRILNTLNPEDAVAIKTSCELLDDRRIKNDLTYIASNYSFLSKSITDLETSILSLTQQVEIIRKAKEKIFSCTGQIPESVKKKFDSVFDTN